MPLKTHKELIRVNGKLKEIVTIKDDKNNIVHKVLSPLMLELYPRDLLQIVVGASILAVPVAFTEEAWNLGSSLPMENIVALSILSLLFIASFVYYNFYRKHLRKNWGHFIKRVLAIYIFSFLVVGLILYIINVADWNNDLVLAFKRTVLVSFPASMSAAVTDTIK